MIDEVVGEEIEIVLSIDTEHADKVGGVHTISEQFDSHSWSQIRSFCIDWLGDGKSCETGVRALEHTCVWMVACGGPRDFGDCTICMDGLWSATGPWTCELITWRVKYWVLLHDKCLGQVPGASCSVSSDG